MQTDNKNTSETTVKKNEIVVSNEIANVIAPHLRPYLDHNDRKIMQTVTNTDTILKGRSLYDENGKDNVLVIFQNAFLLKRTESKKVEGEYIPFSRHKFLDHKNDENYEKTNLKDKDGNIIYRLKHTTVTGWKQRSVDREVHELPTVANYPYPIKADAAKLNKIVGAALTELKNDQYRREKEKRPIMRKTGSLHMQIFVNGKMLLNTQHHTFEGMPTRLLFSDFKLFAVQMFERAKEAAAQKMGTVNKVDANAIFAD